jgi:hypothetical protein
MLFDNVDILTSKCANTLTWCRDAVLVNQSRVIFAV